MLNYIRTVLYAILGHLTDNLSMPLRPNRLDALALLFDVLVERLKTYKDFLKLSLIGEQVLPDVNSANLFKYTGLQIDGHNLIALMQLLVALHNKLQEANDLDGGFVQPDRVIIVCVLIDHILDQIEKLKKVN